MAHPTIVRFAPSPTGALHIGSIRTLLYNYLLAKKTGGKLILRIEDTDQKRLVNSAEDYLMESLHWLGIVPDEGPLQGGGYGPYRQSERTAIYKQHLQPLLASGHAYYAFDTPEEIESMRARLKAAKIIAPPYNAISRGEMKNALTLPAAQVNEWIASGKPYVIRLKMPHKEVIRFYDELRGWIKVDSAALDDKVLIKADGLPTYHFANVIDDYLMQITHVIRGEEWLPSTPLHLLLYRYLGWGNHTPKFVHLPLLLAPDGRGKLSKRHADQYDFPAFPITWNTPDLTVEKSFYTQGYLPEALWNFLALLGWNPGTGQEIFTKEALIEAFSLERLGKSSVQFDVVKAHWFNQQHMHQQTPKVWSDYFIQEAAREGIHCNPTEALAICKLVKDRTAFPKDFWQEGRCFIIDPNEYDAQLIQKQWNKRHKELFLHFMNGLSALTVWNASNLKELLQLVTQGERTIMPLLRMALTGRKRGPELIASIICLGKERTYARLHNFTETTALP